VSTCKSAKCTEVALNTLKEIKTSEKITNKVGININSYKMDMEKINMIEEYLESDKLSEIKDYDKIDFSIFCKNFNEIEYNSFHIVNYVKSILTIMDFYNVKLNGSKGLKEKAYNMLLQALNVIQYLKTETIKLNEIIPKTYEEEAKEYEEKFGSYYDYQGGGNNKVINSIIIQVDTLIKLFTITIQSKSNDTDEIDKIFYQEMSTINITKNYGNKIICLLIYAIYQMRNNIRDKILVCSASNSLADSISLELLRMKEHINKLNILRIYAKNQEIIERNKRLDEIIFHKLIKRRYRRKFRNRYEKRKWLIKKNDVIISTCVNSYNDDIINFKFPFVIIIDANNSNENENLIPITLNAKHVLLISYEGSDSGKVNLYKRMKNLYPENHCEI